VKVSPGHSAFYRPASAGSSTGTNRIGPISLLQMQTFTILTVTDEFTKEGLVIEVDGRRA
jgi:hypothetical protein